MKKQLLLFLLTFLPLLAHAFTGEVEIDGIRYFIKTGANVAEVRGYGSTCSGAVVIPPSVVYEGVTCNVILIANGAFYDCTSLTSITIPNGVISIGENAFNGCTSLTSIAIGNSVTSIGGWAFSGCTSLTSITIPNSVTSIAEYAFYSCTSLTAVYISDIAAWCKIDFHDSVSNPLIYAHHLYLNGEEIKDLVIPNSVTNIGQLAFWGCSCLTSITIPNSVTSIDSGAFYGCSSLTSITIPNSVTSIGSSAFCNCSSLTSITIGSGIQSIESIVFADCPDLNHVYCHAVNVPNTNYNNVFEGSYPQYATLHVPDESVESYRNKFPWSLFGTIVGLSGGGGSNNCAKPTISYQSGKLMFNSATAGATCLYSITDSDIKSGSGNEVQLTVTYHVSVYATKVGMENSDVATATLCWIDKEPVINTDINNVAEFAAKAVLIQSEGGTLTIQGADDGTPVSVYTSAGIQTGSAISKNGVAIISTNMQPGSIAIVKIGSKSVKVVIK